MPKWIHDRAHHIMAENPDMSESQAWAIATQQSHATGKTPKGYGTPTGKHEAKQKYDEPKKSYEHTADPGKVGTVQEKLQDKGLDIRKEASTGVRSPFDLVLVGGFSDELQKIANSIVMPQAPTEQMAHVKSTYPSSNPGKPGKYSKVNTTPTESPSGRFQPVTAPPPVLR